MNAREVLLKWKSGLVGVGPDIQTIYHKEAPVGVCKPEFIKQNLLKGIERIASVDLRFLDIDISQCIDNRTHTA